MGSPVRTKRLTSLPTKYYELIGEVIFHWSLSDAQVTNLIGMLLGMGPKEERLLVGRLDEKQKLMMLRFLSEKSMRPKNPIRKLIANFIGQQQMMADRRNQFCHSPWVEVPGQTIPAILNMNSVTKRYSPNAEIMTDSQMENTLKMFRDLTIMGEQALKAMKALLVRQAKESPAQPPQ